MLFPLYHVWDNCSGVTNNYPLQVFYCAVCAMMLDTEERVVRHITARHGEEAGEEGKGVGEEGERCRGCAKSFSSIELLRFHEEECPQHRPYRCG